MIKAQAANPAWAAGTSVAPPPRVVSKALLQLSLEVLTDPAVASASGTLPRGPAKGGDR